MAFDYINEAFKRLDLLEEQMFDTSLDGINKLSDFMDNDDTEEIVRVIDPKADTDEDIQDSYVGKVIVNCNVCHSHVFENKEDIKIEEDGSVNVETSCPYCGEQEGFTIVGEIAPYSNKPTEEHTETDTATEEDPTEEKNSTEEEKLDEALGLGAGLALGGAAIGAGMIGSKLLDSYEPEAERDKNVSPRMSRASRRLHKANLDEDFKEVSITTEDQKLEMTSDENGKVTVTTEPVTDNSSSGDMIVPVSDETEAEILDNNEISNTPEENVESEEQLSQEQPSEETEGEESSVDLDFDEVDEEGMDELGESYLRKVYENVKSFKTTSVAANDQALIVEGMITFTSGAQKKTGFMFEAQDVNTRGQLRFRGTNKHIAESMDTFSLVGRIDNKKLFVESLKYNYKVNEESVRGLVRRK